MSENITLGIKIENNNPDPETKSVERSYYLYDTKLEAVLVRYKAEDGKYPIQKFEEILNSGKIDEVLLTDHIPFNIDDYYQNVLDDYEDSRYRWYYEELDQ